MALNRQKLAGYHRQKRKWGLLTQLALIIAFCASLSPIIRAEMFGNCADIVVQYGLVQHVFRFPRLCMLN